MPFEFQNAFSPIDSKVEGKTILEKPLQYWNALALIVLSPSSRTNVSR